MYIKEAHIMIEQGLQSIGVFAYGDVLQEEVDISINKWIWNILEEDFKPKPDTRLNFQQIQANLDKYKDLVIKDSLINITKEDDYYIGELPEDYYHLIKDRSITLRECSKNHIITGKIEEDEWYIVKGRTITYNSSLVLKGQVFKGVENVTGYTSITSDISECIFKLEKKKTYNRLTEEENIDEVNSNPLTTSRYDSVLSTVSSNKIYLYFNKFFIEKLYISYLKKPLQANSRFTQYTSASSLTNGTVYEVIQGVMNYNSNTYTYKSYSQLLPSFTYTGGAVTGTGKLRIKGEGDIEMPRQICLEIINKVVLELKSLGEQNQQSINNVAELNNIK
jgi:hypothetical protein